MSISCVKFLDPNRGTRRGSIGLPPVRLSVRLSVCPSVRSYESDVVRKFMRIKRRCEKGERCENDVVRKILLSSCPSTQALSKCQTNDLSHTVGQPVGVTVSWRPLYFIKATTKAHVSVANFSPEKCWSHLVYCQLHVTSYPMKTLKISTPTTTYFP